MAADAHEEVVFDLADGGRLHARIGLVVNATDTAHPDGYVVSLRDVDGAGGPDPRIDGRPDFHDLSFLAKADGEDDMLDAASFVVFDTETTGLKPRGGDRLVQIAAVRISGGRLLRGETFDTLVNPGRPIPAGSTAIHGISDADVANAPDAVSAIERFHRFCDGATLIAHNAPFDMAFLQGEGSGSGVAFDHPTVDTVLLSALAFPHETDHTLDGLAARLGVTIPEALRHTALGDAEATAAAFLKLIPILQAEGLTTVSETIEASERAQALRRKQAASTNQT